MGKKKKKPKKKPKAKQKATKATVADVAASNRADDSADSSNDGADLDEADGAHSKVDREASSPPHTAARVQPEKRQPAPPAPSGLVAQLLTSGHTTPGNIWGTWFFNLLAAIAWNAACYPMMNRLVQGQSTPAIKLLDISVSLFGALLLLRIVTLLSDLQRSPRNS